MRLFVLLLMLLAVPCGLALDVPEPTGFVVDTAGMLGPGDAATLTSQLTGIEKETTIEIAVLTIKSLEDASLEEYANTVFREWGIGKKDVNNGVLILIVEDSRDIRIEVGTGLEGVLTDAKSGLIIRYRLAPAFREGAYADGIAAAAQDIALLATEDPATVSAYAMESSGSRQSYEFLMVMFVLAVYGILIAATARIGDKKRKGAVRKTGATALIFFSWIAGVILGVSTFWLILLMVIMLSTTTGGHSGVIFFPGGGRGGGGFSGGGFGGFGGGFSGGGGASGGW